MYADSMKKSRKLLVLFPVLVLAFYLTACGKTAKTAAEDTIKPAPIGGQVSLDAETVCGQWKAKQNISPWLDQNLMDASNGILSAEDCPVFLNITLDMKEDGGLTVSCILDAPSFQNYTDQMISHGLDYVLARYWEQWQTQEAVEAQLGMTIVQYSEMFRKNMEQAITQAAAGMQEGVRYTGYYAVEGDKLYVADNAQQLSGMEEWAAAPTGDHRLRCGRDLFTAGILRYGNAMGIYETIILCLTQGATGYLRFAIFSRERVKTNLLRITNYSQENAKIL